MSALKVSWAVGVTVIFTFPNSVLSPFFVDFELSARRRVRMRRMYSTEHSTPVRVEWPTGRVLGPVMRKKMGKEGTETLSWEGGVS
jgi:hypothetical protein